MALLPVTVVKIKTYGQLPLTLKGQMNRTAQFVVLFFEVNSPNFLTCCVRFRFPLT